MTNAERLRAKILRDVETYYFLRHAPRAAFSPGKSRIPYAGRIFDAEEIKGAVGASLDFWLTAGPVAERLEAALADWLGVRYGLLTSSGSSANLLAVSALTSPLLGNRRLVSGDEVITTAAGFPTTLNPILQHNAIPVFVDIEEGTWNASFESVRRAVSTRTKAVVLAHTLGNPFDAGKIRRLCDQNRLWLIEDNCDALGSRLDGRKTGTFGHLSTSSFYPAHHMTTGEGGAVFTNDPLLKKIVASFRDWGRDCWCPGGHDDTCKKRFRQKFGDLPQGYDHKYVYSHVGYNLKMTEMQAAIGQAQLAKLSGFLKARHENFLCLNRALKPFEPFFVLPASLPKARPAWFGFPLLVRDSAPFDRAEIVDFLEGRKIATRMLFGGNLLKQPAYRSIRCRVAEALRTTDRVMERLFWIGLYPGIRAAERTYMIDSLNAFLRCHAPGRRHTQ